MSRKRKGRGERGRASKCDGGGSGSRGDDIESLGLKHSARILAAEVGLPLVPGSRELVHDVEDGIKIAEDIGWPILMKCTAGGGGIGLVTCQDAQEMKEKFESTQERAEVVISSLLSANDHFEQLSRRCSNIAVYSLKSFILDLVILKYRKGISFFARLFS